MTAYIKMIDIWLVFAMLYPFFVVMLYSILQFLRVYAQDVPVPMKSGKLAWKTRIVAKIVNFLLDFGLPIMFIIFIIIFWILGIINTTSEVNNFC